MKGRKGTSMAQAKADAELALKGKHRPVRPCVMVEQSTSVPLPATTNRASRTEDSQTKTRATRNKSGTMCNKDL